MKPRSTVNALLAITESLIAARAKARAKQSASRQTPRGAKIARFLTRPLVARIRTLAFS